VLFEPGEVVVVVDLLLDGGAEQPGYASADPVAAGVGVGSTELHGGDVLCAEVARNVEVDGVDHHAVGGARRLEEPGGDAVAEATRAEVDANPDAILLVDEEVDVVVAAADGAELRVGLVLQGLGGFGGPAFVGVDDKGRVRVVLGVAPADAEGERVPDVVHDAVDVLANLGGGDVETHGLVAAGDVEADGGGRDAGLGRDDAADRDAVAEMSVGHEGEVVGGAGADARLFEGVGFVVAPDGDFVDVLHWVVPFWPIPLH